MDSLPDVRHQAVHLTVNPKKQLLRGWTELHIVAPAAGRTSIGVHALGLQIGEVLVNGIKATVEPRPPPGISITSPSAVYKLEELGFNAYKDALMAAQHELGPDLIIQLPDGWREAMAKVPEVAAPASEPVQGTGAMDVDGPSAAGDAGHASTTPATEGAAGAVAGDSATPVKQEGALGSGGGGGAAPMETDVGPSTHSGGAGEASAGAEGQPGSSTPSAPKLAPGLARVLGQGQGTPPAGATATPGDAPGSSGPAPGQQKQEQVAVVRITFSRALTRGDAGSVSLVEDPPSSTTCGTVSDLYFMTDPQLRRARALFPCVDALGCHSTFSMAVTVPPHHTAVCAGWLVRSVVSCLEAPDGKGGVRQVPHSRTFYFETKAPVTAAHMLVATGPFTAMQQYSPVTAKAGGEEAGAGAGGGAGGGEGGDAAAAANQPPPATLITHFAPPRYERALANTTRPLYLLIREMSRYLGTTGLPWPQVHIVWVPAEVGVGGAGGGRGGAGGAGLASVPLVGANIIVAPASLLLPPTSTPDHTAHVNVLLALAGALARQWFGVLLLPRAPEDAWVAEGLAGHVEDVVAKRWLGQNEAAWRRYQQCEALALADDGAVPPLSPRQPTAAMAALAAGKPVAFGDEYTGGLYGASLGTELLTPGPLRRWKAAAVMRMLERKVGEDQWKRQLGGMVARAVVALEGGQSDAPALRQLSTSHFLKHVSRLAGLKGGSLAAFAERWVHGRGMPEFILTHQVAKTGRLDLALWMRGGQAARRGAWFAAIAAKASSVAVDDSHTEVKIAVHESDSAVAEVKLKVGLEDTVVYHEHELSYRPGPGRKPGTGKKKKGEAGDVKEEEVEAGAGDDAAKLYQGLLCVRLDPAGEWLARTTIYQPEILWVSQLEKSRDVVAQSIAVKGLARIAASFETKNGTSAAVSTLVSCLTGRLAKNVYCRVRAEAAVALGATASQTNQFIGVSVLYNYFQSATRDAATQAPKPPSALVGADLGEALVVAAVPLALALARDAEGYSPPEALQLLEGFLESGAADMGVADEIGGTGSTSGSSTGRDVVGGGGDAMLTAACVEALGYLQYEKAELLAAVLRQLDRQLALEYMCPSSPTRMVGRAALDALGRLAATLTGEAKIEVRSSVRATLRGYTCRDCDPHLRRAAARALMELDARSHQDNQPEALLESLLWLVEARAWGPAGLAGLLEDAVEVMGTVLTVDREADPGDEEERTGCSTATAYKVYRLMCETQDARVRHYALMLIQRAAKMEPMLYRPHREEDAEGNKPVGQKGQAAATQLAAPEPSAPLSGHGPVGSGGHLGSAGLIGWGGGGTAAAAQAAPRIGKIALPQGLAAKARSRLLHSASHGPGGAGGSGHLGSEGGVEGVPAGGWSTGAGGVGGASAGLEHSGAASGGAPAGSGGLGLGPYSHTAVAEPAPALDFAALMADAQQMLGSVDLKVLEGLQLPAAAAAAPAASTGTQATVSDPGMGTNGAPAGTVLEDTGEQLGFVLDPGLPSALPGAAGAPKPSKSKAGGAAAPSPLGDPRLAGAATAAGPSAADTSAAAVPANKSVKIRLGWKGGVAAGAMGAGAVSQAAPGGAGLLARVDSSHAMGNPEDDVGPETTQHTQYARPLTTPGSPPMTAQLHHLHATSAPSADTPPSVGRPPLPEKQGLGADAGVGGVSSGVPKHARKARQEGEGVSRLAAGAGPVVAVKQEAGLTHRLSGQATHHMHHTKLEPISEGPMGAEVGEVSLPRARAATPTAEAMPHLASRLSGPAPATSSAPPMPVVPVVKKLTVVTKLAAAGATGSGATADAAAAPGPADHSARRRSATPPPGTAPAQAKQVVAAAAAATPFAAAPAAAAVAAAASAPAPGIPPKPTGIKLKFTMKGGKPAAPTLVSAPTAYSVDVGGSTQVKREGDAAAGGEAPKPTKKARSSKPPQ